MGLNIPPSIARCSDVVLTNPVAGDVLVRDANNRWINQPIGGGGIQFAALAVGSQAVSGAMPVAAAAGAPVPAWLNFVNATDFDLDAAGVYLFDGVMPLTQANRANYGGALDNTIVSVTRIGVTSRGLCVGVPYDDPLSATLGVMPAAAGRDIWAVPAAPNQFRFTLANDAWSDAVNISAIVYIYRLA